MRAYVHVPFCRQKCGYCKFALTPFVRDFEVAKYFAALEREILAFLEAEGDSVGKLETLYFGGGTPSAVPVSRLSAVIRAFADRLGMADGCEITAEANPEDLTREYCHELLEAGVTRLSVGVQSLDDAVLASVGRKDAETALTGLKNAFAAGFANVNADLILGLPHEKAGGTLSALKTLHAEFPLTHTSLYLLEEGAYPKNWKGTYANVESVREEFLTCRDFLLNEKGFAHYEVSNFAKPGFESKHNRGYWERKDVRGFGLAASSLWKGERFENAASFAGYYRGDVVGKEALTPEQVDLERALCGIRTFSLDPELVRDRKKMAEFTDAGWVSERDGKILPTSA